MAKYTLPPGEKGQFAVIPDGVYKMQITSPKLAYAKASANPTIECYLAVLEGQYAGERVYHQYTLTTDSLWRLRDDLRTLGKLSPETYPVNQGTELDDSEMVRLLDNAVGYASIFIDTYRNAPRSKLATEGFLTHDELSTRGITPTSVPPTQVTTPVTQPGAQTLPEAQEPF